MLHVGLTGNVAAGKSTVAALFRALGRHDHRRRRDSCTSCRRRAARCWPPSLRGSAPLFSGPTARSTAPALRARVLADPTELAALNAHRCIRRCAARRRELVQAARARGATGSW